MIVEGRHYRCAWCHEGALREVKLTAGLKLPAGTRIAGAVGERHCPPSLLACGSCGTYSSPRAARDAAIETEIAGEFAAAARPLLGAGNRRAFAPFRRGE